MVTQEIDVNEISKVCTENGKYESKLPLNKIKKISFDDFNINNVLRILIPVFIGLLLIWFGLTMSGSMFTESTRFKGLLATVFYTYQAGTFMAIAGSIAIYDAVKRTGYL